MTPTGPQNIPHSVRDRLMNLARRTGQDYNRLLVRYALERLLYRLSVSNHAGRFVLKGAMLFAVWSDQQYRSTQDLDLLGFGNSSPETLTAIFEDIAKVAVGVDDGMVYLADGITAEVIREHHRYGGVRIHIESMLGKARIPLLVDVGFGDVITPSPQPVTFPALLDYPAPNIQAYRLYAKGVIGQVFVCAGLNVAVP